MLHLLHSVKSPVTPCVTGDYDGRDYENYHIMECDTMWPVRNLLTFQGNGYIFKLERYILKMNAALLPVNFCPATWHHIP